MTTSSAPADTSPAESTPVPSGVPSAPAPPSLPWRRAALILAGAAQLITISALLASDYPLAATWWSLLLAIAPAPVAAAPRSPRAPVNRLAAVVGLLVLIAGIAGGLLHIGVLFVPALVVLAVGTVMLWREQR